MPIDDLIRLRRYVDSRAGISEEFLEQTLGPKRSWAILTSPLTTPLDLGWVICPSLGVEHGHLRRLEALVAKSLAAAGFTTVRIRPESRSATGPIGEIDLESRLQEVEEAVEQLRKRGTENVGTAGALFGATVAALTCERLDLPMMALWEPTLSGARFMKDTLKRHALAEIVRQEQASSTEPQHVPSKDLAQKGWTMIRGLRLSRQAHDAISRIDLTSDLRAFNGSALLVGVTLSGERAVAVQELSEHLKSLGGDVQTEDLQDPLPVPFGEMYFTGIGPTRIDSRLDLDRKIADATARWAMAQIGSLGRPRSV